MSKEEVDHLEGTTPPRLWPHDSRIENDAFEDVDQFDNDGWIPLGQADDMTLSFKGDIDEAFIKRVAPHQSTFLEQFERLERQRDEMERAKIDMQEFDRFSRRLLDQSTFRHISEYGEQPEPKKHKAPEVRVRKGLGDAD